MKKHKHIYKSYFFPLEYVPIDQTGEIKKCWCGKYKPINWEKGVVIIIGLILLGIFLNYLLNLIT